MPRRSFLTMLAMLALAVAPAARAQDRERPGDPAELNEAFREPDVGRFVERFESESREVFAHRREIVEALGLEPGMEVADIGAGTGLFTIPMAEAVGPEGAVFAVDIAPDFLRYIADRASGAGLVNVCTVLGTQESTQLPPASIDLAYVCDTYHHFEDPAASLASIRRALRPGGRLVVVEFDRREGESSDFVLGHIRADREQFVAEIEGAGFEKARVEPAPSLGGELEENFIAVFRKPDARPEDGGR